MKKLKYLKTFENMENTGFVSIIADTSAVVLNNLSEIEIGELCIKEAKKSSDIIKGDIYVLVILRGFSSGNNIYYYNNNGDVSEINTQEEYINILNRYNIKNGKDLKNYPSVKIDLYGK